MRPEDVKVLQHSHAMLDRLEDCTHQMTAKEVEFIEDISDQLDREDTITEPQYQWLVDIADKY